MSHDNLLEQKQSRRAIIRTALAAGGAYVAPAVLSVSVPSPAFAQVSATGTLTGTVTDATTGNPISGATVAVGGVQGVTNGSGVYSIPNAPAGSRTVTTSATGYITRNDTVNITAGGTTTFSPSLVSAAAGNNITIVLNWAATPRDLDSHTVGPDGVGGRFHCYYANPNPVAFCSLDHDVTQGFGPETTTVSTSGGNFVAGSYSFAVHNFANDADFSVSQGHVAVFQSGAQIANFLASGATGDPTFRVWYVFDFTLTATPTGGIVITPKQVFQGSIPTLPSFTPPAKV